MRITGFSLGVSVLVALSTLTSCAAIPKADPPVAVARPAPQPVMMPARPVVQALPRPTPQPVRAAPALVSAISALGASFEGKVGIAVRDVNEDWVVEYAGRTPYPQQSVSKLWVAITALDAVDRGVLSLSDEIVIRENDLTLFNQPISQFVGKQGYRTTVSDMLETSITKSDNTANDALLNKAGGPEAVRAKLARHGLTAIKFGPGERKLQAQTAGLTWRQDFARGQAFQAARAKLPLSDRTAALDRYLASPPDGASPVGIVDGLAKLHRRELLSDRSTETLISAMRRSKTGPQRLKGGLSPGWLFAHKTGTGQDLYGRSTGYNDIALLTAPDGRTYAVAVMIGETRRPIPERMRLMQAVTRAVIANHRR